MARSGMRGWVSMQGCSMARLGMWGSSVAAWSAQGCTPGLTSCANPTLSGSQDPVQDEPCYHFSCLQSQKVDHHSHSLVLRLYSLLHKLDREQYSKCPK